jgi:putative ABC transport system permease protein
MKGSFQLAWRQISKEKARLVVALAGVSFAVVLVSMQLGFRGAMYASAVRLHQQMTYDLVMLNPATPFIGFPKSFTRRRLYQILAIDGVEDVTPIYIRSAFWKNPWTFNSRSLLVLGFDPSHDVFKPNAISRNLDNLKLPDVALFDRLSRPEFGPVGDRFAEEGPVVAEINNRRITVIDLYELGTSFGIDGSLITSDLNFRRIFPNRIPGLVEIGLIHLHPGVDRTAVRDGLIAYLEPDVLILTPEEFVQREVDYWGSTTPIGYVFGFGAIMGLIVGCVIVYQILFADVMEHSVEYATLKAIGYRNYDLSILVLLEAGILGVLGFFPGLIISLGFYSITTEAIQMPLEMTTLRALTIFLLTLGMCALSGLIALRKVRATDPAEVFG